MQKHEFIVKQDGKELKLRVIKITPEIRLASQRIYAKALNDAIQNGYSLRIEMEKVLEDRKAYDAQADEEKAIALRKKIKDLEIELRQGIKDGRQMTKEEGRALALQIKTERQNLRDIGASVASYFNNTAESYASGEQMQYWLYACTVFSESGKPYWPSYEAFKEDTEGEVYKSATEEFLSMMLGIDKNQEANLYENKWLKFNKFVNDDLQLINEQGQLVDSENRLIDKEGRYINSDGEYVDIYGNRIDKEGNLLIEDTWGIK